MISTSSVKSLGNLEANDRIILELDLCVETEINDSIKLVPDYKKTH